jgi:hypothetical protein
LAAGGASAAASACFSLHPVKPVNEAPSMTRTNTPTPFRIMSIFRFRFPSMQPSARTLLVRPAVARTNAFTKKLLSARTLRSEQNRSSEVPRLCSRT